MLPRNAATWLNPPPPEGDMQLAQRVFAGARRGRTRNGGQDRRPAVGAAATLVDAAVDELCGQLGTLAPCVFEREVGVGRFERDHGGRMLDEHTVEGHRAPRIRQAPPVVGGYLADQHLHPACGDTDAPTASVPPTRHAPFP